MVDGSWESVDDRVLSDDGTGTSSMVSFDALRTARPTVAAAKTNPAIIASEAAISAQRGNAGKNERFGWLRHSATSRSAKPLGRCSRTLSPFSALNMSVWILFRSANLSRQITQRER